VFEDAGMLGVSDPGMTLARAAIGAGGARAGSRGDYVVGKAKALGAETAGATSSLKERVAELQRAEGLDEMAALKRVARERGISKSQAYRELQRERARRRGAAGNSGQPQNL